MNVLGQLLHENIFDFNKSFSCKTHFRKVGIDTNLNEEEEQKLFSLEIPMSPNTSSIGTLLEINEIDVQSQNYFPKCFLNL